MKENEQNNNINIDFWQLNKAMHLIIGNYIYNPVYQLFSRY